MLKIHSWIRRLIVQDAPFCHKWRLASFFRFIYKNQAKDIIPTTPLTSPSCQLIRDLAQSQSDLRDSWRGFLDLNQICWYLLDVDLISSFPSCLIRQPPRSSGAHCGRKAVRVSSHCMTDSVVTGDCFRTLSYNVCLIWDFCCISTRSMNKLNTQKWFCFVSKKQKS